MLFRILTLTLILLQGALMASVKSESSPRSRQKRCTCYSYTDKECVYYCHLDIIWINTPERTVPYGMSNYRGPKRRRRDATAIAAKGDQPQMRRCICAVTDADPGCRNFCHSSLHQTQPARILRMTQKHL